ncbi:MAG: SDR family oxidoreductase [Sneathiella sp.]
MKVIIFGATGTVGRHIIHQTLDQGHQVTAFTRSPEKYPNPQKSLSLTQGNVLDLVSVKKAIQGQDAVLCALGMPLLNKDGLRAKGTEVIVKAMETIGPKRFIGLSMMGVGDSREQLPFHYKYLILPLLLKHVGRDHQEQEKIVRKSGLDWTFVRPVNFTKGPQTGSYWHGFSVANTNLTHKISAADVADFMVKQLSSDQYLHQAPCLSYQA